MLYNIFFEDYFKLLIFFFAIWLASIVFQLRKEMKRMNRRNLYDREMKSVHEKLHLKIMYANSYNDLVNIKDDVKALMKENDKHEFKSIGYHYITLLILAITENKYFKIWDK